MTPQQAYEQELAKHEEFIKNYRFFLDRICNHLAMTKRYKLWTPENIRMHISNEIDYAESMDRPNKPGSEFANND